MHSAFVIVLLAMFSLAMCVPLGSSGTDCKALHKEATLKSLDFSRYLGLWYELYHSKTFYFDHDCVCTTADYTLNEDGTVKVDNGCVRFDKKTESIGKAKIAGNASLEVSFGLPLYAPYDVVYVADDYSYAAVMSCSKFPIFGGLNVWILGRERDGAKNVQEIETIFTHLKSVGLESALEGLVQTNQTNCGQ